MANEEWLARAPDPAQAEALSRWLDEGLALWRGDAAGMGDAIKGAAHAALFADPRRSEWLARGLVALGERVRQPALIALGEMALGDGYRLQGRLEEGYRLLDLAAERFLACGDRLGWARTRIGWLGNLHHHGWQGEVEPVVRRAEAIFVEQGAWGWLASLCNNYATYCQAHGLLEEQARWAERARQVAARLSDPVARQYNESIALGLLLDACNDLGEYERAHTLIEEASPHLEGLAREFPRLHIDFLLRAGRFYQNIGWYARGLHYFYEARRRATAGAAGFWELERLAMLYIATSYHQLNRNAEAEALLQDLLAGDGEGGQAAEIEAEARITLAGALSARGQSEAALASLEPVIERWEALDAPPATWLSVAYQLKGRLLHELGHTLAAGALERALHWASLCDSKELLAQAHLLLAEIAPDEGAREEARARALDECEGLPWLRWRVYHLAARQAASDEGRIASLERAASDLDTVHGALAASFQADYMTGAHTLYEDLVAAYLHRGEVALAWQTVERARSRALLNAMLLRHEGAPALDPSRYQEWEGLRLHHARLVRAAGAGRQAREERLALERELLARQEAMEVQLFGRREPLAPPPSFIPNAPGASDLVGYYLAGEQVHGFVHNGHGYHHARLPATREQLARLSSALHAAMRAAPGAPDDWIPALHARSDRLLERLDALLLAPLRPFFRHNRLAIVPWSLLHQLPFSLFRSEGAYLLDHRAVQVAPTARVLAASHSIPSRRASRDVVIAHSWEGRVPGTLAEGRLVASLLPGATLLEEEAATRERVWEGMRQARVLHIAAHGEHRADAPHFSCIHLADGLLTVSDLFHLSFQPALVTLSACDSGRLEARPGDEGVGLVRALLAAGARSLLVTLWQLEDECARELMRRFYRLLQEGVPTVAALRAVQCEWIETARGRFRHPFYWGGLQLIGDDLPLEPGGRASSLG